MPKFRKKPVVIEAVQFNGGMLAILDAGFPDFGGYPNRPGSLLIPTLEGDHECRPGDWIIKGVKGEFYPCKPDIFDATYEALLGEDAK